LAGETSSPESTQKRILFEVTELTSGTMLALVRAETTNMSLTTASELSHYLKGIHHDAKGVDKLKIAYRPFICPFDDLLELVRPNEKVFDIGCGSGQFALLLARFVKPAWIGGVDISENLIRNARDLMANSNTGVAHEFQVFDGKWFPPALQEADRVFLIDVLHHVPPQEQESFLTNLNAGMRPGSVLVLKDIDAASILVYFNKFHDMVVSKEIGHEISAKYLLAIAQRAGFRLLSETHRRMLWYPHFTMVLQRD
jgi:2-polyprenyl-3-methyl-5-hydroxy-6-metoxy-1,4-benzoquinol methylase